MKPTIGKNSTIEDLKRELRYILIAYYMNDVDRISVRKNIVRSDFNKLKADARYVLDIYDLNKSDRERLETLK